METCSADPREVLERCSVVCAQIAWLGIVTPLVPRGYATGHRLVTDWSRQARIRRHGGFQKVDLSRTNVTGHHPSTWTKSDWGSRGRRFKPGQPDHKGPGRRG